MKVIDPTDGEFDTVTEYAPEFPNVTSSPTRPPKPAFPVGDQFDPKPVAVPHLPAFVPEAVPNHVAFPPNDEVDNAAVKPNASDTCVKRLTNFVNEKAMGMSPFRNRGGVLVCWGGVPRTGSGPINRRD